LRHWTNHALGSGGDRRGERVHRLQLQVRAFGKVLADAGDEVHFTGILPDRDAHSPNATE
jgi:hypothetical protein